MAATMPAGLSVNLLEKILKTLEKDETISIVKTAVNIATKIGDGYSSDIYRINIEYIRDCGGEEITEKRSLIVKATLTAEGTHKDMIDEEGVFNTEIDMMTSTLKEMQMLLKDVKLSGKCFYAHDGNPIFLVLEDLCELGYRMADRGNGLDVQHCLLAMRGLAQFHASSVAVCEKNPEYKLKYPKGVCYLGASSRLANEISSGVRSLAKAAANWPDISEICASTLMKLSRVIYKKVALLKEPVQSDFNVINHGDCWINNMLFRYNAQNQPVSHIFVDFQCSVYASPAVDLQYFLNTSLSEDVTINHTDRLIDEYHQVLCETMKKINCKTQPPTLADLKKSMRKLELYGVMMACLTLPFVLRKKNEAIKLEDVMDESGHSSNTERYATPEIVNALSWRLLDWERNGLLDNY